MTLSDISIRNPVFAWMLMAALILFGWIGFSRMGVSEMPDVDFPVLTIQLSLEGAAPEVMESDVVDIVEDAITSVEGVREVNSTSRLGEASVVIEFDLGRDIDAALQEVQTKVAQAQRRLPTEMDPPVIIKSNTEDHPILWLGLSGKKSIRELMLYTRDHLKDVFQTVPGVGDIFLGGYLDPNLRIWLDARKLASYELTVDDVIAAIEREHIELPAGYLETPEKEFNVRAMGEATTPEEFEKILILERGGTPIYQPITLGQVATVERGLSDFRRISRVMGETSVGIGIRKQRGANSVEVAKEVRRRLEELRKTLPEGFQIDINFDSTRFIEESIGELKFNLILSALLTGLVCWLFLGSLTSTLNILVAIPTSIIGTFLVLYFNGFTLNTFTLLGLILSIGIVVDDAIMVLENIVRHQEGGEERMTAALKGARQITFAALASTLGIAAIFLPVAFMKGIIGKFFFQFGVTISAAVFLSLLEALTLTPMRCSQFVSSGGERTSRLGRAVDDLFEKLKQYYRHLLEICLRHRWKVIVASLLFFVFPLSSLQFLRKELVPPQDESMFLVRLQTPVGSSLIFTDNRFRQAESLVMKRPEVRRYFAAVGGFGGGEANSGILFITLKPKNERKLSQQELMEIVRKEFNAIPDLKAFVQDLSIQGFAARRGYPVEFTVQGPDWERLIEYSQKFKKKMEENPIFTDVDTDYQSDMPEVRVLPDRTRASERGVSVETIARVINAAIGGMRVGKYTEGGRRDDIRIRLQEDQRSRMADAQSLLVRNNRGELIPLGEVTSVVEKPSLMTITRKNRERAVALFANIAPDRSLTEALKYVSAFQKELPEGYRIVFGGTTSTFRESFESLIFALWLGVIVAYMILASQFNSFLHPFTVLLALPFSISGAFLALWIGRESLNIYSMIGLILLMGIVKKNSILLVDFTNRLRREGETVHEALLKACPIRLRPILMTSFSTLAAAIPPALGIGPGAETRIPMAIAVIGGLLVSTFLTLFIVPTAYSLLTRLERKKTVST